MGRKVIGTLLGLALFSAAGTVNAAIIVSATGATASSTVAGAFGIGNTINQSGLSTGFTSGVTDFDTFLAGNPTHSFVASGNEWFTAEGVTSATVTYDLGSAMTIDRLALWNDEFSGLGLFNLLVSLDNSSFSTVLSGQTPTDNPSDTDYGADVFAFGPQVARYIQLDISGCPQPLGSARLFCGIGEVGFSNIPTVVSVPEPATLTLFGIGLIGLGFAARRRNAA